jgi:hypothetical protein
VFPFFRVSFWPLRRQCAAGVPAAGRSPQELRDVKENGPTLSAGPVDATSGNACLFRFQIGEPVAQAFDVADSPYPRASAIGDPRAMGLDEQALRSTTAASGSAHRHPHDNDAGSFRQRREETMADKRPAYVIAEVEITDSAVFQDYVARAVPTLAAANARIIAHGTPCCGTGIFCANVDATVSGARRDAWRAGWLAHRRLGHYMSSDVQQDSGQGLPRSPACPRAKTLRQQQDLGH